MRSVRYALILVLFALGTGLAAVAGWRYARTSSPVNGPIVLISVDSLRADWLAPYGGTRITTPAIARLARDGVVFERAYTHSPQTLPAHAALLSGRLPFENGVRDDAGPPWSTEHRVLAEMLSDRGYATAGIVSSFALRRGTGLARGFTLYDDELEDAPLNHLPAVRRSATESERRAERWLSAAGTSRAFLFLHLDEHPSRPDAPAQMGGAEASPEASYARQVARIDEAVGRLVAYLEKQQLYDQSTVVLLSDRGKTLSGEHTQGVSITEDTLRIPFIIKLPAGDRAGQRVATLVQLVDVVPTILDLAKAPLPRGLRGQSLDPVIRGGELGERLVYAESQFGARQFGWSPVATLTDGRYRFVRASSETLYNIESSDDAGHDLLEDEPEQAKRFRAALTELLDQSPNQREQSATGPDRDASPARAATHSVAALEQDRLRLLGLVGPFDGLPETAADRAVDPTTKLTVIAGYRTALVDVVARRWGPALDRLRRVARDEPDALAIWSTLATFAAQAERYEIAVDAYRHVLDRQPEILSMRLALASVLAEAGRFDEARKQAEALASVPAIDPRIGADVHELLARIAVDTHNPGAARVHAQHAAAGSPQSVTPSLVEGRLLFERERYEDALASFDEARARASATEQTVPDLHYFRGEALARLNRVAEAEEAWLAEIAHNAFSVKARGALAALYHAQGRAHEAAAIATELTDRVNTPRAHSAAARLWTMLGDTGRAARARADGRRAVADSPVRGPRAH